MSVAQFINDCKQDLEGLGSFYPHHMGKYKTMIFNMDDVLESDKTAAHKFKKCVKSLHSVSLNHTISEVAYGDNMEKIGSVAISRESESGIGTAFLKLSYLTKELANHRKIMCENLNNMVLFPLNSLLKGDMNKIGYMKKPIEESWKEYKSKGLKRESRKKTTEIVLYRVENPEVSDESERERRQFMYNACEYLAKANEVKTKKGVELVQHLIEYYHAQLSYFNRGIELLENMRSYFDGLAGELQQLRLEKDEERKELLEIKNQLKILLQLDSNSTKEGEKKTNQNYKLHGHQGDKNYGGEKYGYLSKRSEGVRKQWQKRYCVIKDGQFTLAHDKQSAPTTALNLLTSQVKPLQEKEKKLTFALMAHNRTYLFQAEDEADYDAWISVLSNAREEALHKAFGEGDESLSKEPVSSLKELTQGIISEVQRLPGNNNCVDCNAPNPTWLSINMGVLVCIECSGIHRDLGVHISRIRSLTLDRLGTAELLLARAVGNSGFNEIMEAELDPKFKPNSSSNMETRKEFIQQKYVQKRFIHASGNPPQALLEELMQAIEYHDILAILQLHAEGVDFSLSLADCPNNGTALHYCIETEDLTSLHIVDFIIQNCKNTNIQDNLGNTPLHLSVTRNNIECTKLLIRAGTQLDVANKAGKTALVIAQEKNNSEIIQLLQEAKEGQTSKCEHVKIDWGISETEDIYSTPLDIYELKQELKSDVSSALSSPNTTALGPILRSQSTPRSGLKTTGYPTPATSVTSSGQSMRHSVALPSAIQVLPSDKLVPPPPARKSTKTAPTTESLSTLSSNVPVLNTFAPKSAVTKVIEKSIGPPTPPTRTSSFIPRGSAIDQMLPRPDRPPPPTPIKSGHNRNVSDGNVLFNAEQQAKVHRNSVADSLNNAFISDIPVDPCAPPLPPPRPKGKSENNVTVSGSITHRPIQQDVPVVPEPQLSSPSKTVLTSQNKESKTKFRRAKALYDCDADHDDELSFVEGEVIIMIKEADPDWWYGEVEGEPHRNGVFPMSFVYVLSD